METLIAITVSSLLCILIGLMLENVKIILVFFIIFAASLAATISKQDEHKPEPTQPRPTYTFGTADTVFSERQKIVYNEIWEK